MGKRSVIEAAEVFDTIRRVAQVGTYVRGSLRRYSHASAPVEALRRVRVVERATWIGPASVAARAGPTVFPDLLCAVLLGVSADQLAVQVSVGLALPPL